MPFQSTLPVKGATNFVIGRIVRDQVSIHAPREGSDMPRKTVKQLKQVSIHAPREGSDNMTRPSAAAIPVSIHAPREGSDLLPSPSLPNASAFQSTLPVKGATVRFTVRVPLTRFQSTLPVKGATGDAGLDENVTVVSIHAPREGSDLSVSFLRFRSKRVSIHAPREGSDRGWRTHQWCYRVSIHAPREGSDGVAIRPGNAIAVSIHAPREGSDRRALVKP